jgi:hypothetical protein
MDLSTSNKEFDALYQFINVYIRKLNMEQLQNVAKYLIEKGYNFSNETGAAIMRNATQTWCSWHAQKWADGCKACDVARTEPVIPQPRNRA